LDWREDAPDFVLSEANGRLSRQHVTIAADVVVGQVLGVGVATDGSFAAAAGVAASGNTGNGTMSTPSIGADAQAGTYTIEYTAAGCFNVYDPAGRLIGEGANGAAFNDQIGFTMTAGGAAFAAGDMWTIVVTETAPTNAGQYLPLNLSATDGTQNAAGISWDDYAPPAGGAVQGVAIVRDAEVLADLLIYPNGANRAEIRAINVQLAALGIVVEE
jgi:hypothetical protein